MTMRYKDIYGTWHLRKNIISEVEIEVDYSSMQVEWDGDNKVVRFKELEK